MKNLYNIKLIKKITPKSLTDQDIHFTWANKLNGTELYATKGYNEKVIILFKNRKSIISLDVTKKFAKEHFKIIGIAKNQEGIEISKYINQENDLR